MIQIFKQRLTKTGRQPMTRMADINADSVQALFLQIEDFIDKIPAEERYNIHYTLCECEDEGPPRTFKRQNIIPFDIDSVDVERIDDYVAPVLEAIGNLNASDCGIVYSGRGLHILVGTTAYITKESYFKSTKAYYKIIVDRINRKLKALNLPGHTDPGLWAPRHTLRMPETKNIKEKHNFSGECKLIGRAINYLPVNIKTLAGDEIIVPDKETIDVKTEFEGGKYEVDTRGVLSQCLFLQHCSQDQQSVTEPQWYAMLSIVSRLENGRSLCHQMSEKHDTYVYEETEGKIDQAITCSKPRTCKSIETIWDGCKACEHYGKCTSPISIKSSGFIKTRKTGFRDVVYKTKEGELLPEPLPGKVNYEDLAKYFYELHPYVTAESGITYVYRDNYWSVYRSNRIRSFAWEHVKPGPNSNNREEFRKHIGDTKIVDDDWFEKTTFRKVNLANGVLDVSKDKVELLPHSKKYGFMSKMDYEYDPKAKCPTFDKFIEDVTLGRKELADVLLEFIGYAFVNEECIHHKALILLGEGSNGKSTLIEVITELAGKGSYSSLTTKQLANDQNIASLQGKLMNIAEETPSSAAVDSSIFKTVTAGGTITAKVVYSQPFPIKVRAKFIMAANKLPDSQDHTHGFVRRLIIVPFDAKFVEGENEDKNIKKKLFAEMPGILNRILEGYQRLLKQGHFSASRKISEMVEQYREQSDPIYVFVKQYLRVEPKINGECTPFSDIYEVFRQYCVEDGQSEYKILTRTEFAKSIKGYIPKYAERTFRKGRTKQTMLRSVFLAEEITESY